MTERKPMEPVAHGMFVGSHYIGSMSPGDTLSGDMVEHVKRVPLYTADQIRAMVEEVRAEYEAPAMGDGFGAGPDYYLGLNVVLDVILERLEQT